MSKERFENRKKDYSYKRNSRGVSRMTMTEVVKNNGLVAIREKQIERLNQQIAELEKELAECRESALKELVERVEKDQSERQVQTINVLELKTIIKEMGVDL